MNDGQREVRGANYGSATFLDPCGAKEHVPMTLSRRELITHGSLQGLDFAHAQNLGAPDWNVPPAVGLACAQGNPGDYEGWKALADRALATGWSLT